jgi:hypothetical protein
VTPGPMLAAALLVAGSFLLPPAPAGDAAREQRIDPCLFRNLVPLQRNPLPADRPIRGRNFRRIA